MRSRSSELSSMLCYNMLTVTLSLWFNRWSVCFRTINEMHLGSLASEPRPPVYKQEQSDILLFLQHWFDCSRSFFSIHHPGANLMWAWLMQKGVRLSFVLLKENEKIR